jgi:hypothetical protein
MPVKDMTLLRAAPPNSFVALDAEGTRILAYASTYEELKEKIRSQGLSDILLWKNPPSWGRLILWMRVRLPYSTVPDDQGGTYQTVYCNVHLGSLSKDKPTDVLPALIDSGAARCLFHSSLASELGLDLESGRLEETIGIGGRQDIWIHKVLLLCLEASFT